MNKKVEIVIEGGRNYDPSHKNGASFTSVDFMASTYGSASPCDTTEEISQAVEHCKERILEAGDRPIVVDKRKKASLLNWV